VFDQWLDESSQATDSTLQWLDLVWVVVQQRCLFPFEHNAFCSYCYSMTATGVIEEIKHLPRGEQSRVIQFAFELARTRQLPGEELSELAQHMVESGDPAEVVRLKAEITRGFYGE
jgi:isocitrate/isopropylmalate dehydrogenase